MYRFDVATESPDRLDLRGLCEMHVHSLWMPAHLLPHEAEEFALDHFKRMVLADLEMLMVCCQREQETV